MKKNTEVDLNTITNNLRRWYYTEIRALVDAAIEACCGRLVTELTRDDLAEIPTRYRASARKSFRPYHVTQYRERDDGVDPREFLTEWVDETTDSHQFVIYTHMARCVALASDNEDAYQTEIGDPPPTPNAAACMAMRADIWNLLDARNWEWQIPEIDHGPDCPTLIDGDAKCVGDGCHTVTPTTRGVRS